MSALKCAALCSASFVALTAPAYAQAPQWTGFYLGVGAGGAHNKTIWTDRGAPIFGGTTWNVVGGSADFSGGGASISGIAGYNHQINGFVVGIETDISHLTAKETGNWHSLTDSTGVQGSVTTKSNSLATVRGRAGFLIENALFFGTAGIAYGNPSARWTQPGGATWVADGWQSAFVWGGGVEVASASGWIFRLEAMHVNFGTREARNATSPAAPDFADTQGYIMLAKQAETMARLAVIFRH